MAIRIRISLCLLGAEVRFDGGHKRDRFLTDTAGRFVEWIPVCPEVEAGFGTPPEPMRLVDRKGTLRLDRYHQASAPTSAGHASPVASAETSNEEHRERITTVLGSD